MTKSIVERARILVNCHGVESDARDYAQVVLDFAEALEFYAKANWDMDISHESVRQWCNRAYNDRGHRAALCLQKHGVKQ